MAARPQTGALPALDRCSRRGFASRTTPPPAAPQSSDVKGNDADEEAVLVDTSTGPGRAFEEEDLDEPGADEEAEYQFSEFKEKPEDISVNDEARNDFNHILCSTTWLTKNLDKVVVIDGTWVMPFSRRDCREEWLESHIPGARFLDIDVLCRPDRILPHMLPSVAQFRRAMTDLGIDNDSHVVIYDNSYLFSACRVYWMFKMFGHKNVQVLDGGLPKWVAEGHPTNSGLRDLLHLPKAKKPYKCKHHSKLVRDHDQVLNNVWATEKAVKENKVDRSLELLLDARGEGRFSGAEPEPRPGVPSGHIPYSINTHYRDLVKHDERTGSVTLKPKEELREYFKHKKVALDRPLVASCGTGVTAAVIYVALREVGAKQVALYDGSWLDYAIHVSSPQGRSQNEVTQDPPDPRTPKIKFTNFDPYQQRVRRLRQAETEQLAKHKEHSSQ
ncbi:hypothetical protein H4R34_002685 [Dimargaris verticillata]|uniref:Rhodanese domain-containing protein n=1 Tax=Dimargaris verticillata TaxID=2761393 RepID=A0A9W8E917_9FUNG|nr:hypothetical protein H4R34_002685 [Dimargaris verticillata]